MDVPRGITWEVLIVDNNSTDNTRGIVEEFSRAGTVPVRYIFEPQQGLSKARNTGIKNAQGKYLLFTDDDVLVERKWLLAIEKTFREEGADCVGGRIMPIWPGKEPKWLPSKRRSFLAILDYGNKLLDVSDGSKALYGANMAFTRLIMQQAGYFNTELGRTANKLYSHEEKEYFERIMKKGGKIIYQPDAVIYHIIQPERVKKAYFRKWSYDDGEQSALLSDLDGHRSLLGIPQMILYKFIKGSLGFVVKYPKYDKVENFDRELWVMYWMGYIVGCVRKKIKRI